MMGSQWAEAKHGALHHQLGKGNCFQLDQQCAELLERQRHYGQGRRKASDTLCAAIKAYRSSLPTKELREDDELAKRALSPYHYKRFQKSLKKSLKMTKICLGLGGCVTLPKSKSSKVLGDFQRDLKDALKRNSGSRHVAYGKRCGCPTCVDWDRQCEHELCGDRFRLDKNSSRLYNDFFYEEQKLYGDRRLEELTTTVSPPMPEEDLEDQEENEGQKFMGLQYLSSVRAKVDATISRSSGGVAQEV